MADAIELQPFYHHVKNTIVRPKQIVVGTRYFWQKWAPRLGPTLTVLVVRLRMHCYYNQATQERRDWCFPTQQTLAEEVGVSRWTVMRELKKSEARRFVRVQYRSRYDETRRQTIRISSLYHVAMDDPLVEEDQGKAAALLAAGPVLDEAEHRNDAHCGLTDPGREVVERPLRGKQAKALVTDLAQQSVQTATGPSSSKLPLKPELEEISSNAAAVARELIEEQVSTGAAYRLAQQYPAEHIRDKMALVRQLKDQQQALRNAPGFLRRAIEDDYQPPLAATGTEGVTAAPLLELRARGTASPATPRLVMMEALSSRTGSGDVWQLAKTALAAEMRPAAFAQWLAPSSLLHYQLGQACIVVSDARIQRYIEQRLQPAIEAALGVACGGPTSLKVIVEGENPNV
ncbi:MAG TPA: hypothetical protein VMW62_14240 [Chloroflexota bacterium]|nr:hypothetical protein [Chloroflexota bacterium]